MQAGAQLDVLHVIGQSPLDRLRRLSPELPAGLEQRLLDDARQELGHLGAQLHQDYGVSAGVQAVCGSLLVELEKRADALDANLVVLGSRGESFMRHRVLGSTAERMVSTTRRPLLVVKQAARAPYQTVLVPVDFSSSSLPALTMAKEIAPGADIVLLHAFEVPFEGKLRYAGVTEDTIFSYRTAARKEALAKMQALCEQAQIPPASVRMLVLQGNPERRVIEQEQEQVCDLIVIGKHGENKVEELLLGSTTKHVLGESLGDVLVSV
ncbi:Universal stress protein family protein [compost metagenome]